LIPFVEAEARGLPEAPILSKIDLLNPLTTCGIFHVETGLELPDKAGLSAVGHLTDATGALHPFVVFPSPFPITSDDRLFDEECIWSACDIDRDKARVSVRLTCRLSLVESMSSMMKLLCQTVLPRQERWWFVRMTKLTALPDQVDWLILQKQRVIADRLVCADVSGPMGIICRIEFMGGSR
jgi:hypothetical protein